MKRPLFSAFAGLIVGACVTWFLVHRPDEAAPQAPAPAESQSNEKPESGLHLDAEKQKIAGIETQHPKEITVSPTVRAMAHVLDASALAGMLIDIDAAKSALAASTKEFERVSRLHSQGENASARAVETAEATMQRDQATLRTASARVLAMWGPALADRSDLGSLATELARQKAALIRVDALPGEAPSEMPTTVRLSSFTGNQTSVEAKIIGPAPSADAQIQGVSYLAIQSTSPPVPGTTLTALLPVGGAPVAGVLVPQTAIVRHLGAAFVWVRKDDDTFERQRVTLGQLRDDGIVVLDGLSANDEIVTVGAQQLLSEELKAGGGGED